ncbi:hypothetical protein Tco_0964918 [Tanacetum coccineum]
MEQLDWSLVGKFLELLMLGCGSIFQLLAIDGVNKYEDGIRDWGECVDEIDRLDELFGEMPTMKSSGLQFMHQNELSFALSFSCFAVLIFSTKDLLPPDVASQEHSFQLVDLANDDYSLMSQLIEWTSSWSQFRTYSYSLVYSILQ